MLREPSRHDGLSNNQAARDLQRERQRQERAQMLVSDDAGLSPKVQDLFNAPVKVKPSVEDQTSIEIRKTFGSYDSARPFLTDNNGALQRRLIGVDQTVNTTGGSANSSNSSSQNQNQASGDHRSSANSSSTGSSAPQKPLALASGVSHRPFPAITNSNSSTSKPDYQNLFKHIPPPLSQSSSAPKGPPFIGPPPTAPNPLTYISSQGQAPSLTHISSAWNLPTPLSPFPVPVRKNNKLSTTTLPITFVTTNSLNTASTTTSEIEVKQAAKSNHPATSAAIPTVQQSTTSVSGIGNSSAVKSEVKTLGNVSASASVGASTASAPEKSVQPHNFKKPIDRNDSRLELDSIIKEMTDVRSPLAAILPKDCSPKKTGRRSSKNDDRTIEALEGINDLKANLSPLSTTGMNSTSSSSGSDSSDSDTDSDSSSGSEMTTPSVTPVKSNIDTTRSPTERESWGLSSFVGGIRKENALFEAASTSLDSKTVASLENENSDSGSEVLKHSEKQPDFNVPSSTSGGSKFPSPDNSTILDTSKALIKSSGFIKPNVPQTKSTSKEAASHAKEKSPNEKGTVLQKPITSFPISAALLAHRDPTLSGSSSSSEDEEEPPVLAVSAKDKEINKISSKHRNSLKRPSATALESLPTKKSRKNSQHQPLSASLATSEKSEKSVPKSEEKGKSKSLDRNKNDMIGRLFRPKKEKVDEGGKEKESAVFSSSPRRDEKTGKFRRKTSPSPTPVNRVSAKDSGRKRNSSPGTASSSTPLTPQASSGGKTNGEIKMEKLEAKAGNPSSSSGSKSKRRSASPTKGVNHKPSGSTNNVDGPFPPEKSEKTKHASSKVKKEDRDREGGKGKRNSETPTPKSKATLTPTQIGGKTKPTEKAMKQVESSPKHKVKLENVGKSAKPSKTTPTSSKSNDKLKIDNKLLMPPPPPGPVARSPASCSPHKESRRSRRDSKATNSMKHLSPPSLVVRIPISVLPRKPKVLNKAETQNSVLTTSSKQSEGKREEARQRLQAYGGGNTSLVGSSVEDVTESIPSATTSKSQRSSAGSPDIDQEHLSRIGKEHSSAGNSHKRSKNRSHSTHKKPRLKDEAEVDAKIPPDNNSLCESSTHAYTSGTTAAKTPPDPPDSSLNPTHSSSPTLALPQLQYFSYFDKVEHQEDFFTYDQSYYMSEAKKLKHRADKEQVGVLQMYTYMDAALHFIMYGILNKRFLDAQAQWLYYEQTFNLIRQVALRPRVGSQALGEDPLEVKLLVLSFRIQSILSYKLYKLKSKEIIDTSHYLTDYLDKTWSEFSTNPATHSPRTTLSTPSPRSPALSPAGSGPTSTGSGTPSFHSPHHQSQQNVVIPKHLLQKLSSFCHSASTLITTHTHWSEGDHYVDRFNVQDFFISIDRICGPLTLHSSLLDLVRYVRCGMKNLNQHLESS